MTDWPSKKAAPKDPAADVDRVIAREMEICTRQIAERVAAHAQMPAGDAADDSKSLGRSRFLMTVKCIRACLSALCP